ncbi:MAG: hypothetical protein WCG08_15880, partial [Paludibacter sp.]
MTRLESITDNLSSKETYDIGDQFLYKDNTLTVESVDNGKYKLSNNKVLSAGKINEKYYKNYKFYY